jgi:hypothetical protein
MLCKHSIMYIEFEGRDGKVGDGTVIATREGVGEL